MEESGANCLDDVPASAFAAARARYKTRSKPLFANVPKDASNHDELAELNMSLEGSGVATKSRRRVFPTSWRLWKPSSTNIGQQRRREESLAQYKDVKYQMMIKSRKMMEAFLESDCVRATAPDAPQDPVPLPPPTRLRGSDGTGMHVSTPPATAPSTVADKYFANSLMLPEYLSEIPPDFTREWCCMPFPNGTRCLIIARDGKTQARGLDGSLLDEFQSVLPCGSSFTASASSKKFTILDCVQVEADVANSNTKVLAYFVLDFMAWNGNYYYNCNAESRFWMKDSRITETEGLDTICKENRRGRNDRLILNLPLFDADIASLRLACTTPCVIPIDSSLTSLSQASIEPPTTMDTDEPVQDAATQVSVDLQRHHIEFIVEGIMFYFRDMDYVDEQTPVMCVLPIVHIAGLLQHLATTESSMQVTN